MNIITVGIDLAKNVFAVHGVNYSGKAALVKPKIARADLLPLIANLPPCLIGMEACSGAHYWARFFVSMATPPPAGLVVEFGIYRNGRTVNSPA